MATWLKQSTAVEIPMGPFVDSTDGNTQETGLTITQPDIRRFLRKLVEADLPEAAVVSFAEILPEITLRPVARANLVGIG